MRHFRTLAAAAVLASFTLPTLAPTPADAVKRVCGDRKKMTDYLTKEFTEMPRAIGVGATGKSLVEVFTSTDGTWTLLLTTAKGRSCIMGAGHSWKESELVASMPKS